MLNTNQTPMPDHESTPPDDELARAFDELVRANYGRLCSFVCRYLRSRLADYLVLAAALISAGDRVA